MDQLVATIAITDEYWLRTPFVSKNQDSFVLHLLARPGENCKRDVRVFLKTISLGEVVKGD